MSAIVDYEFYSNVYCGKEADETSFPALCARATDVVEALTHYAVTEENINTFVPLIQKLYKKAICAQIDFFAVNGLDAISGGTERGWTVGKVSMSGKSGSEIINKGSMAEFIAPMVSQYLEQTGLLSPQVQTARDMPLGWWW